MRLYIFMGDLKHEKQYEYQEKYLKKHNEYPAGSHGRRPA